MTAPAGYERPRLPVAATPAWLAAVESAGWQCQCTTGAEQVTACGRSHRGQLGGRCQHSARGPLAVRLILTAEGAVYCEQCAEGRERAARRLQRDTPPPAGYEQGDLFDLAA